MKISESQTPLTQESIGIAYTSPGYRLNYHIGILLGPSSILWAGHIIHIAVPHSRSSTHKARLTEVATGNWITYSQNIDNQAHIHGYSENTGGSILTFIGGLKLSTNSLILTDISHHHLALGILLVQTSQMYQSIHKSIGHRIRELTSPLQQIPHTRSLDLELAIILSSSAQSSSYLAQHIYLLPTHVFITSDYTTVSSIYTHHIWISSFCILGSTIHTSIFIIRDYKETNPSPKDVIVRVVQHKQTLISHLSWVSLWLGFHTLLVYTHNDTVSAFGEADKQISIEPIYAQIVQASSGKNTYGYSIVTTNTSTLSNTLLPVRPTDLLAHHSIALGLHTTALILIKGSLDARGSKFFPDKSQLRLSFPCDGPGRGGTCDISSWDSIYLSLFWMLNTVAWTLFYFHWKSITIWQYNNTTFEEGGIYLMAWFRDYL